MRILNREQRVELIRGEVVRREHQAVGSQRLLHDTWSVRPRFTPDMSRLLVFLQTVGLVSSIRLFDRPLPELQCMRSFVNRSRPAQKGHFGHDVPAG
jgi:hypothetical protein